MATNTQQTAAPEPAAETAAPEAAAGGLKSWLPLIATVVAMPVLAYVTTVFVIVPQLKKTALHVSAAEPVAGGETVEDGSHGNSHGGGHGSGPADGAQTKTTLPFGKVLVNVSGSAGTRYLLANLTLVGASPDFKAKIDQRKDQLLDLASSTLSTKTIADLEKPGARNLIRAELIAVFNSALGTGIVQEVYFTEFAIQ